MTAILLILAMTSAEVREGQTGDPSHDGRSTGNGDATADKSEIATS